MMENDNPWIARMAPLLDPEQIRLRVRQYPAPIFEVNGQPVEGAIEILRRKLNSVFYPTRQCVEFLQEFVEIARVHARAYYSDDGTYVRHLYGERSPLPEAARPVCITGHAGIGKSELINALKRLTADNGTTVTTPDGTRLPLQLLLTVSVKANSSVKDLLAQAGGNGKSMAEFISSVRYRTYRNGLCYLVADEFQFASQRGDANAQLTKMLFALSYIGLPWTFVANFSLVRRLLARPVEDRQRLLARPRLMLPDAPDSEDWIETVRAQFAVAPDVFSLSADEVGPLLGQYTAGQKRAAVDLILIAYRKARKAKNVLGAKVTTADLEWAYSSTEYSVHRWEVEEIYRRAVTGERKDDHLSCPFEPPPEHATEFRERATTLRAAAVAEKELESALTPRERKIVKKLRAKASSGSAVANCHPTQKRRGSSAEELQHNANWLTEQI